MTPSVIIIITVIFVIIGIAMLAYAAFHKGYDFKDVTVKAVYKALFISGLLIALIAVVAGVGLYLSDDKSR